MPSFYASKLLSFSFICALLLVNLGVSQAADNVLLIIADDYGVDSNGLYAGAGSAPTPNLDALAASGVRFTQCWANPICSPTRASILTGRNGFRTGVGSPTGNNQIPLSEFSIAAALNTAGYHTGCIGKWHLSGNGNGGNNNPNLMGFDHFEGTTGGGVADYFNYTKVTNGVTSTVTDYATSVVVDDAIAWITSKNTDPWFCWVAFNAPHTPFHVPPAGLHSFTTLSGTAADIAANPTPYYQAMIEAMDTEIGRLLNNIDPAVLANTTVIFVGDNGSPGQVATDFERGNKGQLFQGGVHVPCFVSGASVAAPLNRTNDAFIHVVDIFATAAELAAVDLSQALPDGTHIDSKSFAPYLVDSNLASFHNVAFAERFTVAGANQDGKTVRNSQYKLLRLDNGNTRFYDLAADPLEETNLTVGNNGGPRQMNFDALNAYLDDLLVSPAAPQIASVEVNGGNLQRSVVTDLTVTFDSIVGIDDSAGSPFTITNMDTSEEVQHTSTVTKTNGQTSVVIHFASGDSVNDRGSMQPSLVDGDFEISVNAAQINLDTKQLDGDADGTGGDNHVFGDSPADGFFCNYGDNNGNGIVDLLDFSAFRATFGATTASPNYNENLDQDGSGSVNLIDFSRFRANFGN